ncbi:hypothetical protein AMECASPLE_017802 [Ameca splendens]|uniref:Uncharacterized protein n=1 Tax=Ameca splendens TaxID=208324 RepID=A0ABV0ZBM6_9TELE
MYRLYLTTRLKAKCILLLGPHDKDQPCCDSFLSENLTSPVPASLAWLHVDRITFSVVDTGLLMKISCANMSQVEHIPHAAVRKTDCWRPRDSGDRIHGCEVQFVACSLNATLN